MTSRSDTFRHRVQLVLGIAIVGALLASGVALAANASTSSTGDQVSSGGDRIEATAAPTGELTMAVDNHTTDNVSEAAAEMPVPEPGDPYFEAEDPDGEWISYVNPRDEYRNPYLGDGSGKLCVTMVNEAGEPITGESIPGTSVTVPTGSSIEWHTRADPFVVEYSLTEHYDRPLDSDQFGTSDDIPQGDGYLDSHCMEWHGLSETDSVSYGEVEIDGEYADHVDVVGYIQQAHAAWDTDVDPIGDAVSYEEAGGGWTYEENASHGQAVVVLQLDPPEDEGDGDENGSEDRSDDTGGADDSDDTDDANEDADSVVVGGDSDDTEYESDDGMPGFGVLVAVLALSIGLFVTRRLG
ncbi:PGF-CTERM sorting domain-containing protein [Halovivax gelatinilyticus]|uniref:PGF-CTERM sorting domain-containing protein n=1 Tax=Halovivax gelatinilyticus TaxID=2961597 RepID=UPI0020CA51F1|nr:PGF-CTERM sorting domain-containing protein [Halovivax gelatinilyticus]